VCFFFCHFFLHKQKEMARISPEFISNAGGQGVRPYGGNQVFLHPVGAIHESPVIMAGAVGRGLAPAIAALA